MVIITIYTLQSDYNDSLVHEVLTAPLTLLLLLFSDIELFFFLLKCSRMTAAVDVEPASLSNFNLTTPPEVYRFAQEEWKTLTQHGFIFSIRLLNISVCIGTWTQKFVGANPECFHV